MACAASECAGIPEGLPPAVRAWKRAGSVVTATSRLSSLSAISSAAISLDLQRSSAPWVAGDADEDVTDEYADEYAGLYTDATSPKRPTPEQAPTPDPHPLGIALTITHAHAHTHTHTRNHTHAHA